MINTKIKTNSFKIYIFQNNKKTSKKNFNNQYENY